jgi:hypothetical protein
MTTLPQYETERLLLELAGLVQRLERLQNDGAGDRELKAHRLEIERARWRLAGAVRRREHNRFDDAA